MLFAPKGALQKVGQFQTAVDRAKDDADRRGIVYANKPLILIKKILRLIRM
jgi:hypothetical protein